MKRIAAFFEFERHGTNFRREMVAGATTFATMAYIIVVNPAILSAAGIPTGPSTVATIVTCIFGTLLMGLYARRPFAIAPLMGENADRGQEVTKLGGQDSAKCGVRVPPESCFARKLSNDAECEAWKSWRCR